MAEALDWAAPWWATWRGPGRDLFDALRTDTDWPMALNRSGQAPVRFIPQAELPEGVAYESHIHATGGVPTRQNLHDFFNALCWMRFPHTKRRLNVLQASAIAQAGGVHATRGPLRDALTLFDENVLLLQAPEPIWQALRARDWQRLFLGLRPMWDQATAVSFGHALTEKLVAPYKSITAHVLCLPVSADLPPDTGVGPHPWDGWLAAQIQPEWLATKPFTPLPVLGIPGWWPANALPDFYDDTQVFRPPQVQTKTRMAQGLGLETLLPAPTMMTVKPAQNGNLPIQLQSE
jgi:Protein of unknown function (DUF3025)